MQATEQNILGEKRNKNNFAILRVVAAIMVIAGHMGHILSTNVPSLFDRPIHTIGIYIFFLIGGFLCS